MSNKKTILVVDDSITTRDYISSFLKEAGYETRQAANGTLALDIINGNTFDCYIIDLLMPEMNGLELLEKLRELQDKTPTIVVTADIQEEVKNECLNLGARDFINKPIINPEVILTSINKAIN